MLSKENLKIKVCCVFLENVTVRPISIPFRTEVCRLERLHIWLHKKCGIFAGFHSFRIRSIFPSRNRNAINTTRIRKYDEKMIKSFVGSRRANKPRRKTASVIIIWFRSKHRHVRGHYCCRWHFKSDGAVFIISRPFLYSSRLAVARRRRQ